MICKSTNVCSVIQTQFMGPGFQFTQQIICGILVRVLCRPANNIHTYLFKIVLHQKWHKLQVAVMLEENQKQRRNCNPNQVCLLTASHFLSKFWRFSQFLPLWDSQFWMHWSISIALYSTHATMFHYRYDILRVIRQSFL